MFSNLFSPTIDLISNIVKCANDVYSVFEGENNQDTINKSNQIKWKFPFAGFFKLNRIDGCNRGKFRRGGFGGLIRDDRVLEILCFENILRSGIQVSKPFS